MEYLKTRRDFLSDAIAVGAAGSLLLPLSTPASSTAKEVISNGNFAKGGNGGLPEGWDLVCPSPATAPLFRFVEEGGKGVLTVSGNGRKECFGCVRQRIRLEGGKTYRFSVKLRFEDIEDLNLHVQHAIFTTDLTNIFAANFNNGIFTYHRDGNVAKGENCFTGPAETTDGEVRLYFRFSPRGRVWWDRVSLVECDPLPARHVTVVCREGAQPKGADLSYWDNWLDRAGELKPDIVLLPEIFNGKFPKDAEPLDGPSGKLLARKAEQWNMYLSATYYEERGDLVYNTSSLFDRKGKRMGTYTKNFPWDPELDEGVTPGDGSFPVFQTDFGVVGIMICYDGWFPEVARMLALKGAELVLCPNQNYYPDVCIARSADNAVWVAVSSLDGPAGIWDSGGAPAGEVVANPTRFSPSSVVTFKNDVSQKLMLATLDLNQRYSPHWWGGPMASAPGGRRVRRTCIKPIDSELAKVASRWWV